MTGQLRYRRTWLAADASRQAPARRAKPGGQAERGGRRPEALAAAARVSGARREPARCAAQQSGPEGVTPGVCRCLSLVPSEIGGKAIKRVSLSGGVSPPCC